MHVLILNGSMRRGGCTDTFLRPLTEALTEGSARVTQLFLSEMEIVPCVGCYACQEVLDAYGCAISDDMQAVVEAIRAADCLLFATPIYTWYCTAPMKAALDRLYGMNKYYGSRKGPSLWEGLRVGIVATCGYDIPYGTSPFEAGIQRLCEHSHLPYIGMLAGRDEDNQASFETPEAIASARAFGERVLACLED